MSKGNDAVPARSEQVAASMQDSPCHSEETTDPDASPLGEAIGGNDYNASDVTTGHACCAEGDCSGHGCGCDCLIFGAALSTMAPWMPLRLAGPVEANPMPLAHPTPPHRENQRPPIG